MASLIQATGKNQKDRPRPKQNKTDRRELTMSQNSTQLTQTKHQKNFSVTLQEPPALHTCTEPRYLTASEGKSHQKIQLRKRDNF